MCGVRSTRFWRRAREAIYTRLLSHQSPHHATTAFLWRAAATGLRRWARMWSERPGRYQPAVAREAWNGGTFRPGGRRALQQAAGVGTHKSRVSECRAHKTGPRGGWVPWNRRRRRPDRRPRLLRDQRRRIIECGRTRMSRRGTAMAARNAFFGDATQVQGGAPAASVRITAGGDRAGRASRGRAPLHLHDLAVKGVAQCKKQRL